MRVKVVASVVVAAALGLAPTALAKPLYSHSFTLSGTNMAPAGPALRLAQRVWHPTCGQLQLSVDPVPEFWGDAASSVAGWASPEDCTVHLAVGNRWLGGPDLCQTILHEAGHIAGFHEDGGSEDGAHSADPDNIMYPTQWVMRGRSRLAGSHHVYIVWMGVDRRCLRAYHA